MHRISTRRILAAAMLALGAVAASTLLAGCGTSEVSATGDGVRFNAVRVATGVTLHYAESGPVDGEPLVLVHGLSDSWFSFSRLLPLLPQTVRAYAVSLRGHGDSDRPLTGYSPRELAADVVAFMKAKGIERATVVGHSLGGFVAQFVVAQAPERIARLVIISSATVPLKLNGMGEFKTMVDALADSVPADFIRGFQQSTLHVPVPPEFLERVIEESAKLPVHVWHGAMNGMMASAVAPVPGGARIPTLILWGEHDAYVPRTEQDALIAHYGSAVLRVYDDTGHAPQWERPEEVARDLAAFLRSEPAPRM